MATKQIFVGSQGPLLYDDTSAAGLSEDQVATKGDVAAVTLADREKAILDAIELLSGEGLLVRTGIDTFALRSIEGTANEIDVLHPTGALGNPKIGLPAAVVITSLTTQSLALNTTVYTSTNQDTTHKIPIQVNGTTIYLLARLS
jgi:hypothetical protein